MLYVLQFHIWGQSIIIPLLLINIATIIRKMGKGSTEKISVYVNLLLKR